MDFFDAVVMVLFSFVFFAVPLTAVAGVAKLIIRYFPKASERIKRLMGFGDIQPWIED